MRARAEVAQVVDAKPEEVTFTSGATESNNLAIFGLVAHAEQAGKRHILTTEIEHKAVLEPIEKLRELGFDVTVVPPNRGGWVEPTSITKALRPDTFLVSVMGINNETGVAQPIEEISQSLSDHDAYLHVDAAQAFGKTIGPLRNKRIDLMSISGHKIFAPKGIGALVARRRGFKKVPLRPIMFGGGQERGLRPGTLPVSLIAGLGTAARIATRDHEAREARCVEIRDQLVAALNRINVTWNADLDRTAPHTVNFSVPGLDSEAALIALKDIAAISNGSACTSQSYALSHVLLAAGLPETQIHGALRMSWCHLTPTFDINELVERLRRIQSDGT
ncbi:putative L-cysteine desulfurase [Hoyosella rhizosphaerae]|uniref:cysteine desulfurase n=1 Tax=Hoyosella rhizosphaerae TaxID=1755582 RepID=A0A916X918_9ACTN|nr:putative L-cysteine desulfurase [Hoyosella rhizosphaerae]